MKEKILRYVRRWKTAKLLKTGRDVYDALQNICDEVLEKTDEQLAEAYKGSDADQIRASSRLLQDKLNHQGREAFAAEFAQNKSKNAAQ